MKPLEILVFGHGLLRKKAKPVQEISDNLKEILDRMFITMFEAPGVGLAGNQVGFLKQVITLDVEGRSFALVNPRILDKSEEKEKYEEGCLSLPGIIADVKRPVRIKYQADYIYENGEFIEFGEAQEAEGYLAEVLQHEIDHLNGVMFIDHLSILKRKLFQKKLDELKKKASTQVPTL